MGNDWDGEPKCSCRWQSADTGTLFYSRIVKADPKCPVHATAVEDTKETPDR